ncbi:Uracil DNA glycosylase superfamily [Plasmodiophora brassicae]
MDRIGTKRPASEQAVAAADDAAASNPIKRRAGRMLQRYQAGRRAAPSLAASFAPVIASPGEPHADPVLLIVGSAPSVIALQRQQYYGNPSNHFWPILGELIGLDVSAAYEDRLAHLKRHRIALWDICGQFARRGSADADIKDVLANPIAELLQKHASIRTVACNGSLAHQLFTKQQCRPGVRVVRLPSSSPAHAMKNPIVAKAAKWRDLLGEDLLRDIGAHQ